jgi:hypothetical protein
MTHRSARWRPRWRSRRGGIWARRVSKISNDRRWRIGQRFGDQIDERLSEDANRNDSVDVNVIDRAPRHRRKLGVCRILDHGESTASLDHREP